MLLLLLALLRLLLSMACSRHRPPQSPIQAAQFRSTLWQIPLCLSVCPLYSPNKRGEARQGKTSMERRLLSLIGGWSVCQSVHERGRGPMR